MNKPPKIEIVVPHGMFPAEGDELGPGLEAGLRRIAKACGNADEWPEKYGAVFENDIFMMHPFCWCDREDCPWCREENPAPNFHYKPTGLKVWWYKYIGRDMEHENPPGDDTAVAKVVAHCLESLS